MTGFTKTGTDVLIWTGDPDCSTAHAEVLKRLQQMHSPFLGSDEYMQTSQS